MRVYHVTNRPRTDEVYRFPRVLVVFEGRAKTAELVMHNLRRGRSVALDCGAYMAMTKGRRIDLDEYVETSRALGPHVDFVAALDVIGDARASERNWLEMVSRGIAAAVPTYHIGDPEDLLDRYLDAAPYVALGGIAGLAYTRAERQAWLDWAFTRITTHRRWPIPVHGWGITDRPLIMRYPWRSVDSSAAFQRRRFATEVRGPNGERVKRFSASLLDARRRIDDLTEIEERATEKWRAEGITWTPSP